MRGEIGLVGKDVGGVWGGSRVRGEIGAGRFHSGTKIGKEVLSLD